MKRLRFLPAGLLAMLLLWSSFPATALTTFDGKPARVSDYLDSGKWLVVMIWASDCRVCNQEISQYVDFHFVHHDEDAQVLGISIDGQARKAEAEQFIARHQVNFPNLLGEPDEVAGWYRRLTGTPFVGTPTFLFFDPRGELVAKQAGAVPTELVEAFIRQQTQEGAP